MKDDSLGSEYLPFNFWYHGMNKIKAGKGYRNDKPLGPIGGKCSECDGDIISIKMNTSAKGFETTSEKVCNKCGLVVPGAFQTIEPHHQPKKQPNLPYGKVGKHTIEYDKDGKSKTKKIEYGYYQTHEQWVEAMTPEDKGEADVAWETEQFAHVTGRRLDTVDNASYSRGSKDGSYREADETPWRVLQRTDAQSRNTYKDELDRDLGLKSKYKLGVRAEDWNRGTDERMKHKRAQYNDYISICKTILGMNNYHVQEVNYIIDTYGVKSFHRQASYEDVISHICLVVISHSMKPQRFSVMVREFKRYNTYNRVLYQRIKDMLV